MQPHFKTHSDGSEYDHTHGSNPSFTGFYFPTLNQPTELAATASIVATENCARLKTLSLIQQIQKQSRIK